MADLPIGACLPELQGYLPEDVPLTTIQGGKFDDCVTTHPSIDLHNWVHSTGGSRFTSDPDVPDGFFACGAILVGTTSEWLFAFWSREGRRFWFYGRIVCFVLAEPKPPELFRAALRQALDRWDAGEPTVTVFHG
jgi:hypothetical protein